MTALAYKAEVVEADLGAPKTGDAQLAVYHQASVVPTAPPPNEWTDERVQLLKRTYAKGASDDEFLMFLGTCKRLKLSPEAKQIWNVPRSAKDPATGQYVKVRDTMVSIDGFRLIAERTGQYQGQTKTEWCGKDGAWTECWLEDAPPFAARVGVFRAGFREPLYRVAKHKAFVQSSPLWTKMPDHMLAKVAEALALRAAFPNECAGVYTAEEMGQAHEDSLASRELPSAGPKQYVENNPAPEAVVPPPIPRLIGKAYKDKHVLIDTLKTDDEVINYVRSLMHAKEADAAREGKWQAYWTSQIASVKDWAHAWRNITDFSESKAEREAKLAAAVAPALSEAEEDDLHQCIHPDAGDDTPVARNIRNWNSAEALLEYGQWLTADAPSKLFASPTERALRLKRVEAQIERVVAAEAAAAEAALSAKVQGEINAAAHP